LLLGAPHVAIAHEVIVAEIEAVDLGAITPVVGLTARVDLITRVACERTAVIDLITRAKMIRGPDQIAKILHIIETSLTRI
jgi:hypothetical protein